MDTKTKTWREKYPEKWKIYNREWQRKRREKIKKRRKEDPEFDKQEREKNRIKCKKYKDSHREKCLKYKREWTKKKRDNNPEFKEKELKKASLKYYSNEDYKKQKKQYFREWYQKNKEKHQQLVYADYYKNKHKWRIRRCTNERKEILLENLGKKCKECGSEKNLEFHHTSYSLKKGLRKEQLIKGLLKITEVLCRDCHKKKNRKYS